MSLVAGSETYEGQGKLVLKSLPSPSVWLDFSADFAGIPSGLDSVSPLDIGVVIDERVFFNTRSLDDVSETSKSVGPVGFSTRRPLLSDFQLGDGAELSEVSGYLFNFPDLAGYQDPSNEAPVPSKTELVIGLWRIDLNSVRPRKLWNREWLAIYGFGISHEVSVRRADGKSFNSQEVLEVLHNLECSLSLAAGGMVAVMLITGRSREGIDCWFTCGHNLVDRYRPQRSVCLTDNAESLNTLLDSWTSLGEGTSQRGSMYRLLRMVVAGNQLSPTESAIIMFSSSIELGDWILRLADERHPRNESLAQKLQYLSDILKVSLSLDEFDEEFKEYSLKISTGTESASRGLAEIRNRVTHPPREGTHLKIPDVAVLREGHLWYREIATLLLLKIIKYRGPYNQCRIHSGNFECEEKQFD